MSKASVVETDELPEGKVWADPTKSFFVTMLTRDIALIDAIMDLVDNSIDGVHRENKKNRGRKANMYKGYRAELTLTDSYFQIKDNCGGIPLDVAKNYAFKMGRSDEYHDDDDLESLGMYGIGMKRAIFKMGLQADITSWNQNNLFKVSVPDNWTKLPDWYFNIEDLNPETKSILKEHGTIVKINKLHSPIKQQFVDQSNFIKDLIIALKTHYGYIVQQGFTIKLNGIVIDSIELNILTTDSKVKNQKSIKPYVYSAIIDKVSVEIIIGLYRPMATEAEISNELEGSIAASESENAGITVLCNDRVVLFCDKTFLTGWGETPVPKYHTQFIAIAGTVHFRSNNPIRLPVTTTKRGLDTSSRVYGNSKNKIKEGLRIFTSFTNNWKTPSKERTELFKKASKINALKPGQSKSPLIKLTNPKKGDTGRYQIPNLPKPKVENNLKLVNIQFGKEKFKIEKVNDAFLNGKASASEVGSWCFDKMLSQID